MNKFIPGVKVRHKTSWRRKNTSLKFIGKEMRIFLRINTFNQVFISLIHHVMDSIIKLIKGRHPLKCLYHAALLSLFSRFASDMALYNTSVSLNNTDSKTRLDSSSTKTDTCGKKRKSVISYSLPAQDTRWCPLLNSYTCKTTLCSIGEIFLQSVLMMKWWTHTIQCNTGTGSHAMWLVLSAALLVSGHRGSHHEKNPVL